MSKINYTHEMYSIIIMITYYHNNTKGHLIVTLNESK